MKSEEWLDKNRKALEKAREAKAKKRFAKKENEDVAQQIAESTIPGIAGLPPGGGTFSIPNVQEFVAYISAITKTYNNPDDAYRDNRLNARNMRHSLAILEPLRARQMAVAELPWHLEPEDSKDEEQLRIAKELTRIIRDIPDFLQFKMSLLEAVWFGRFANQIKYRFDFGTGKKRCVIDSWLPLHGDSLVFSWEKPGTIGLYVQPIQMGAGTKDFSDAKMGLESRYHEFTKLEREAIVLHKHEIQTADFFFPEQAAGIHGIGLRNHVYWTWHQMNTVLGWIVEFAQRSALGQWVYRFQAGNPQSEAQVKQAAEAQCFQLFQLWPGYNEQKYKDIERFDVNSGGMEQLIRLVTDVFGQQIKRFILGQVLSSEVKGTAVGNEVASFQEDTFERIIKYDAQNLDQTLSRDLVPILLRYNYPGCPYRIRFVSNVEKPDPDIYLRAAREAYNMGLDLDADELREKIGLSKPTKDSTILRRSMTGLEEGQLQNAGTVNDKLQSDDDDAEDGGGEPSSGKSGDSTATKIDAIKNAMNAVGVNASATDIMNHLQSGGLSVSRSLVYRTLQDMRGADNKAGY